MTAIPNHTPYGLYTFVSLYPRNPTTVFYLVLRLVFLGIGGLILLGALWVSVPNHLSILAILVVVWGTLGGVAIVEWKRRHNLQVYLYQEGFIVCRNTHTVAVLWGDITTIYQRAIRSTVYGVAAGTYYTYTIHTTNTGSIQLTNAIKEVHVLGHAIQRATFESCLQHEKSIYDATNVVRFGLIHMTPEGITIRNRTLAWAAVHSISISNGYLHIKRSKGWGSWARIQVATIPNMHVFGALIAHIAPHVDRLW